MIFSLFILQLGHARELRFLAIGGFCLGIAMLTSGLRARRNQISASIGNSPIAPSSTQQLATDSAPPRHEVIRLSSDIGPTRSADMTQQEKIAAALTRAGVSLSDPWKGTSAVAVETPDEAESASPATTAGTASPASHQAKVLLWCGIVISVASLWLFVIAL